MAQVISADEIKKTLPGYSPEKSELFHTQSARIADRDFDKALKENPCKEVVLLCGGTASGKTEFLDTQLIDKDCLIFDATLSTEKGAEIKIRNILRAKKVPVIFAVIPDNLGRAFIAFLSRERKFSDTHFYRTHSGSRRALLWIATNFKDIEINLVESSYTSDQKLQFAKIEFESRQQLINYLTGLQTTETGIISQVEKTL
ncbi:MAG: hypothetical protein Q7S88_03720 [Candidatus Daviesbacteria bacterium]|nr:hypothetical protein [Candidatus Daviesbacteria bacterium]